MNNPFTDIDDAFLTMFKEEASLTTKEGDRQTLKVCIFDNVEGEPLIDEGSMETTRRDIQLSIHMKDWNFVKRLTRGDKIEVPCRGKFSVQQVINDPQFGIVVKARGE